MNPVGYTGRPRPPKMHLRTDKGRRRTLCGREVALANSVHGSEAGRLHLVNCKHCQKQRQLAKDREFAGNFLRTFIR